jgi:hypothetical protein
MKWELKCLEKAIALNLDGYQIVPSEEEKKER